MTITARPSDAVLVACDVCLKEIPRSEAVVPEAIDYVAHFCGMECYETWKSGLAANELRDPPSKQFPAPQPPSDAPAGEVQLGHDDRGPLKDERIKQLIKRHPQRDEPRIDSVEWWEIPPR